jgi:hypothetical protein
MVRALTDFAIVPSFPQRLSPFTHNFLQFLYPHLPSVLPPLFREHYFLFALSFNPFCYHFANSTLLVLDDGRCGRLHTFEWRWLGTFQCRKATREKGFAGSGSWFRESVLFIGTQFSKSLHRSGYASQRPLGCVPSKSVPELSSGCSSKTFGLRSAPPRSAPLRVARQEERTLPQYLW